MGTGASRLREQIQLQVKTNTRTSSGGTEVAWATVATVWARTWGASGAERLLATEQQAQVLRHFQIRYYPALTAEYVVVYGGRSYNISFVNHVPLDGFTFFDGKELDNLAAH